MLRKQYCLEGDPLKWAKICGSVSVFTLQQLHIIIHHNVFKIICSCSFYAFRCTGTGRLLSNPCTVVSSETETVLPKRCKLCCIGPQTVVAKKGQGMWHALCATWPLFRRQEAVKCRGLTAFLQPKVAHSPLELFSFFVWWENITSNKRKKKRGMSIIVHFSSCWKREFRLLFQKRALGSCGETLDDFESYHITIRNSEEEIAQIVSGLARCQDCGAFESRLIFVPFRCQLKIPKLEVWKTQCYATTWGSKHDTLRSPSSPVPTLSKQRIFFITLKP